MRCHVGPCWNRGQVDVHVWEPEGVNQDFMPPSYFIGDDDQMRPGRSFGLCYGCYLRLVRVRRRAGEVYPWPKHSQPLESKEFWAAFEGWEPEPENPSDEYLVKMEETVWRNR